MHTEIALASTKEATKLLETYSICPVCSQVVEASIYEKDDKVFMSKFHCGKEFLSLQENDVEFYKKMMAFKTENKIPSIKKGQNRIEFRKKLISNVPQIYLSITNKCNLKCPICFELDRHGKNQLDISVIKEIVDESPAEQYVLSGGEPTMHTNLINIISFLKSKGKSVFMTTNGLKLADPEFTKKLKDAGLDVIGLSFDGLDEEIYKKIRGRPLLKEKLLTIKNAREVKIPVGLYSAIDNEVNINKVKEIIDFAAKNSDIVSEVWFGAMNKGEETSTSGSDIWKEIQRVYGISLDYVFEERKWRYLTNIFLGKMFGKDYLRKFSTINHNTIYVRKKGDGIMPFFGIDEIRGINKILEESIKMNKLSALKHILLNSRSLITKNSWRLLKALILSSFSPGKTSDIVNQYKDVFWIRVGGISEAFTVDLLRSGPMALDGMQRVFPLRAADDTPW